MEFRSAYLRRQVKEYALPQFLSAAAEEPDSMPATKGLTLDASATYTIRIQGYLGESWIDYLDGVSIQVQSRPDEAPVTVVTGEFQDQAALAGALGFLYDLGLPLLSVECIGFVAVGDTK
jgi:hypothetical protein